MLCGRNNESDLTMEGGTTGSGDILSCMLKVMDMRPMTRLCWPNKLPKTCNRMEATWQKAVRLSLHDHENIMEEAGRRDRLEYDDEEESEDDELESEEDDDDSASDGE